MSWGTTVNRSPTTPKSAISKIGASGSLLIAMIVFDVCIPARCWIAPEIPTAAYSCGDTVLPVWPTWNACGYQPASVTARDAPTAAPSASASCSITAKPSADPVPRPPETTICASCRSGRAVLAGHDVNRVGQHAGPGLDGQPPGDLLALRRPGDQHCGGRGRGDQVRQQLGLRGDHVVGEVGPVGDVNLLRAELGQ